MPPPVASRDSPRTLHGRRRAPRGQLNRPGSIFGAIKNIVTAPLAWLTSYDDHENLAGKRGRNNDPILEDEASYHEDQPSAKRKRVDSPQSSPPPQQPTRTTQGYLDVPERLLSQQHLARQRPNGGTYHGRSSSMVATLPLPTIPDAHPARRTASPTGISSYLPPSMMQRTQSMDPPVHRALSISRDVSMEDGISGSPSRDVTMSPSRRTAFQLRPRSSLTPQPTGQSFGPTPRYKERDASEPPPLAALMSKPAFVKPPPQQTYSQVQQPLTTLGTIAESNGRNSRSPMRQHSGLFLGARGGSIAESSSAPYTMPMNAAEVALHDLDVYKTPLLPSRLRGSQTIPDMFKPKKMHPLILMHPDRERNHKPRLGMSEKKEKQDEEAAVIAKPYAGRGGMKKMLARRKREEQEELEKERANAIETDQDELDSPAEMKTSNVTREALGATKLPSPLPAPVSRVGGREQSSLRVGRTRTSRNHIARPVSKSKNRFSAVFDDDEGEDNMVDEDGEPSGAGEKLPALFESPKGFTFAQEKAPVMHDSSNAKEPPLAALPFSLTKSSATTHTATPVPASAFSFTEPTKNGHLSTTAAPEVKAPEVKPVEPDATSLPPVPSISFIPPSPAPAKPATETPKPAESSSAAPSIPNFFANSSIFTKPGVTIAPPAPSAQAPTPSVELQAQQEPVAEPKTAASPFNFGAAPIATPVTPQESVPVAEVPKSSAFSFGASSNAPAAAAGSTPSPFSFGGPPTQEKTTPSIAQASGSFFSAASAAKQSEVAPVSEPKPPAPASTPFSFGAPPKPAQPTSTPTSLPFSFGASTPATNPAASAPAASPPLSFGQSKVDLPSTTTAAPVAVPASPFSFGQQELPKAPETKSLFGATETAKPPVFGAPTSSPSPFGGSQASATEPSKPAFTFGQPASSPAPSPAIEAPKPLFPSTSNGGTGGFNFGSTAAPTPAAPATSAFSFGAATSTPSANTPVENKPAFTFGQTSAPAVSAPTTLFGGPSSGSQGADLSKSFAFGAAAPTRPLTPPQKEQEMRMEESPTRGGGMDMNGGQPKPSNAFSFGSSSTAASSPFGQPSQSTASPFAFGAKTEPKVETKSATPFASFGQNATSSPFSFGQKPAESVQSPISPAPFGASTSFGQTPTTTSNAFNFGAPTITTSGFGQPTPAMNSQPGSPSTFGQPGGFGFGATPTSTTTPSNPFAFGSQPASPATGNAGLPQPPGSSGGFTFGSSPATAQAPASPFGAPPSLPTPTGGVGFTIGSSAPQQSGARQIKKLPNRRGGRR